VFAIPPFASTQLVHGSMILQPRVYCNGCSQPPATPSYAFESTAPDFVAAATCWRRPSGRKSRSGSPRNRQPGSQAFPDAVTASDMSRGDAARRAGATFAEYAVDANLASKPTQLGSASGSASVVVLRAA
jgi:hypothetical protein